MLIKTWHGGKFQQVRTCWNFAFFVWAVTVLECA